MSPETHYLEVASLLKGKTKLFSKSVETLKNCIENARYIQVHLMKLYIAG